MNKSIKNLIKGVRSVLVVFHADESIYNKIPPELITPSVAIWSNFRAITPPNFNTVVLKWPDFCWSLFISLVSLETLVPLQKRTKSGRARTKAMQGIDYRGYNSALRCA